MSLIEKSKDMERRYEGGIDTWGNRERRLYQSIFKKAVDLTKVELPTPGEYNWFDVGCGGGNIWDTVLENSDITTTFTVSGCDIVPKAVDDLINRYPDTVRKNVFVCDLEEEHSTGTVSELRRALSGADVVSFVDVLYYLGEKRDYRETLDELWEMIRPGCIVICADSLIPYQRRSYLKRKPDCILLHSYTDYTEPVSEEVNPTGRRWHRYLKVMIYKKGELTCPTV